MKQFLLTLTLALAILLSACTPAPQNPQPEATPGEAASLPTGIWQLIQLGDPNAPTPALPDAAPTIEFDAGQLGGSAGCNSYFGEYTVSGSTLTVAGSLGSTMMACDEPRMSQETAYLSALAASQSFSFDGTRLVIRYAGGELVFEPQPAAIQPPLEGTLWQLTTIVSGEVAQSVLVDTQITAQISAGQINGSAGCNQYFAPVSISGETLQIGAVGATKMACAEPVLQQETLYLLALEAAENYALQEGQLVIRYAGGELIFAPVQ